ncbi:MAG: hypothetical protein JWQ97_4063, partial [Phenylobacterium sp.]|nr:hypothetical protein [Phenylobacterium sp.]
MPLPDGFAAGVWWQMATFPLRALLMEFPNGPHDPALAG